MSKVKESYKEGLIKIIKTIKEYGEDGYLLTENFKEILINDYEIEESLIKSNMIYFVLNIYNSIINEIFDEKLLKILNCYMVLACKESSFEMPSLVYCRCITRVIYYDVTNADIKRWIKSYDDD